RSTQRACAVGPSSGRKTTTSAHASTTGSTNGTATRLLACRIGKPMRGNEMEPVGGAQLCASRLWHPDSNLRWTIRLQLAVSILVLGSIYALIACGYVLIYRVSRVLNLAHGELMMLGAYFVLATASLFNGHPGVALAAAILLSLVTGGLVYIFLMRKMTGEMVLAAILTTVALGILVRGIVILIWSAQQQYPAQALGVSNPSLVLFGGARISLWSAVLVATTFVVYGALFVFLRFGRWGMRMRAAGQNPLLAAQRGINLHGVYALAWSLSTLTGALAGVLMALDSGLTSSMPVIGLKAFPAALVGGLDSFAGALIGALIVAGARGLVLYHVDPPLSALRSFLVLIAMLIVRPWGLFGTREELDRV